MAKGKYQRKNKYLALIVSMVLLLTIAIGGTLAYIMTKTAEVQNQFDRAVVESSVNSNGTVTNEGNVNAYIRAAVVVNWQSEDGKCVYGTPPAYTINTNTGWEKHGDFYYYTVPVSPNGVTTTAPATVKLADGQVAPDGYSLCIEVVAEAIQAEGIKDSDSKAAVLDAWGITPGG